MEKFLPLFPLKIVAFPGEQVNLHVFEPRYKQMIKECLEGKTTFGIPSFVNGNIELGTEVEIVELSKTYNDGRMDIKTQALDAFKVISFEKIWRDKLYAGGMIAYLQNIDDCGGVLDIELVELAAELFSWIGTDEMVSLQNMQTSFELGHKVGLTPSQEYIMLGIETESDRQQYLIGHLKQIIPALKQAEHAREQIKMNGHFKNLDPLKF